MDNVTDRPLLLAIQHQQLAATLARAQARALRDAAPADKLRHLPGSPAGDEERLRKIPVCAPGGWGGVIPGTHPERETIRRITAAEGRATVRPVEGA